ncbi:energy transducer TonB [Acetobacteraceae bacterium KSS8]|uniref:Energy transducer TonB n=1 Tax=Endosaccharibacter trunci TaxID=2812733 RepID=A0ABT1W815_9PROT|nr:energy transducer TonB [Acetobacteraceae bacterium KSS8]
MARSRQNENRGLTRAALISGGLHAALLLALIIGLPPITRPPEPPEPPAVEMDFVGPPAKSRKGDEPAPKPVEAPSQVEKVAPPSPTPPEKMPVEEPPPPPPPPTPVPPPPQAVQTPTPPLDIPPKVEEPSPEVAKPPPPKPAPPSPARTPSPPVPHPTPDLPKMTMPSHVTQPNKTTNAQPDTHSLLATLEKFRADQPQTHPPRAHANPDQGGSPSRAGDVTGQLTAGQQKAIGGSVRRCYAEDTEAKDYATFTAHLLVTVDATGEARRVDFKPDTAARMAADPGYRALAERARDAVLNPTCAKLPIPPSLLGKTQQLSFVFRP